jgi:hypothetical protein
LLNHGFLSGPGRLVLMDEGFLTGLLSNGVSVHSHCRHKVNFHSWVLDLTPGCLESCRVEVREANWVA